MKILTNIILAGVLCLVHAGNLEAATRAFTMQANMPLATGVAIRAVSWTEGAMGTHLPDTATTLSFDSMTFNSTYGYWAPDHYFSVDFNATGGSGDLTTTVSYIEGANPNSAAGKNGLGHKAIATFMKVTGYPEPVAYSGGSNPTLIGVTYVESEMPISGIGKKRLTDLNGLTVTSAQVSGGWLRIYLGIATGNSDEPAGTELFTNQDQPGTYDGILTFTATIS